MKNGITINIPIHDRTGAWLSLQDKDGDNVSILHTATLKEGKKLIKAQQKIWKKSGIETEIVQLNMNS
jgi:hypothetical protein